MHRAQFWEERDNARVQCNLCRFHCVIADGRRGRCGVRENHAGTLYTLVYGRSIAEQVDPIEKKPLFHFQPGSRSLSIATVGCNFRCLHCQNADISQWPHEKQGIPGEHLSPQQVVADAAAQECASIAYTYTEPTIFYEYAYDTAVLAREAGIRNVFVTNGYTTTAALEKIARGLRRRSSPPGPGDAERRSQAIDIIAVVIERERRAGRTRNAKVLHDRHRTVMTGAIGDALVIQMPAEVVRVNVIQQERLHARLVARFTNQPNTVDLLQCGDHVVVQLLLVTCDVRHADGLQVIDGSTQTDNTRYIRRTRLEFVGQFVVDRLVEADLENHVAATLPWRQFCQH